MFRRSSSGSRASLGPLRVNKNGPDSTKKPKNGGALSGNRRSSASSSGPRKSMLRPLSAHKINTNKPSIIAPATKKRRSSARGYGHFDHIKDPRPVSDRAYKERSIRELVQFLTENGYPHPISPKLLQSPISRDFVRIFEFLVTFIDPKYKVGPKMEEEIPRLFKSYGYPFNISKSSMYAVGSPHTWPTLLAALTWLRLQINYTLSTDVETLMFSPGDDAVFDVEPESKFVFTYCEKAYGEYMNGADTFDELEEELARQIRNNGAGEDLEQLAHENKRLQQELESLEHQPDQLLHLKDTLSSLKLDYSKFNTYVQNLQQHKTQREQALLAADMEEKSLDTEYQALQADIKKKQNIFKTQEFSQADVQRINKERQELVRQIDAVERENESLDKQVWDEEIKLGKSQEKIEEKCSEYNKIAQIMQLIPSTAENAFGVDYQINPVISGSESHRFVSTIKPALITVKNKCMDKEHEASEKLISEKDTFDQLNEMVSERVHSHSMMEGRLKRLDEQLENKKENLSKENQRLQMDIETLHEELYELRKKELTTLHDAQRLYLEEKKKFELSHDARQKTENKFADFIYKASDIVVEHKEIIQKHVKNVVKNMENRLEDEQEQTD